MKEHKNEIIRIALSAVLFAAGFAMRLLENESLAAVLSAVFFVLSVFVCGFDVLFGAVKGLFRGMVLDEKLLMSVACIGAFFIGEYPEAAAVMLFYQIGELFQSYAVGKSRKSISSLMAIRPDRAVVLLDGKEEEKDPYDVKIGDIILIKPGEKIPLDCVIINGSSSLDTCALTGEAMPKDVFCGDTVLSGCINISGVLTARVTKEFEQSTASKILSLVEDAAENKSKSENFITKFAHYYTPAVVVSALLLAVLPPLFIDGASFQEWVYRALSFLVVSCPCALVISVPLSFFAGIGLASKNGILIKGSNFLETLSQTNIGVFDKTGTLTEGSFCVTQIHAENISEEELIKIAAHTECHSSHPIAQAIRQCYGKDIDAAAVTDYFEDAGFGITAKVFSLSCSAGNSRLMEKLGIAYEKATPVGTAVHIARDGEYLGYIIISDSIKSDSASALRALKACGIEKTVMLTGDSPAAAEAVANALAIDELHAGLLPQNKVETVKKLIDENAKDKRLFFAGDGINDAPVLALSDVGIAMGAIGSDAAIEAADIVIMTDEISKIPQAIRIAKKTLQKVRQNIVFSIAVKLLVLTLVAVGIAPMWVAVFADVGVAVIAILNAMSLLGGANKANAYKSE